MSQDAPPKGKLFPCPACGAKIEFDPATRSLKCPYCGHATAIAEADTDEQAAVVERDFEEYLEKLETGGGGVIAGHSSQVRCTGCGAMVLLEDKVVTEKCPFCGTHLENKPESAAGMIPPESLVPFEYDYRAARSSFEKWMSGLWFAPSELTKVAALGQLNGVYVPYWTYDAMTYTRYRGERGDDYQETETYTTKDAQGNDVTQTRTVTKTRWTSVSGHVDHFFDDVLVCGTKSVPDHLVSYLVPWDLEKLEPFKAEFLSGFKCERYGVGLQDGFHEAKRLMEPEIKRLIYRDIGGDHQRIHDKRTQYTAVTFKHLLLPMWVAYYRYHEKLYQILVNGRTGKVSGERPYSAWKIVRLILLIVTALVLVGVVISLAKGRRGAVTSLPPRPAVVQAATSPRCGAGIPTPRWRPACPADAADNGAGRPAGWWAARNSRSARSRGASA
jgi:DNA-directed RNA polymerase subunit RPC12/RpoP